MQQLLNYMGGPGPNRPKTTMHEKGIVKQSARKEGNRTPQKEKEQAKDATLIKEPIKEPPQKEQETDSP